MLGWRQAYFVFIFPKLSFLFAVGFLLSSLNCHDVRSLAPIHAISRSSGVEPRSFLQFSKLVVCLLQRRICSSLLESKINSIFPVCSFHFPMMIYSSSIGLSHGPGLFSLAFDRLFLFCLSSSIVVTGIQSSPFGLSSWLAA